MPATLIAGLTAQRTAALRTALGQRPDIALAAVTHALARRAFYPYGEATCLGVAMKHRRLAAELKSDDCPAATEFETTCQRWREHRLPQDGDALWAWCLSQTQDVLLELLALLAAHALDAMREKHMRQDAPQLMHADALADALGFDMGNWFTPTAADYFHRVNRAAIMDAMVEAGTPARTRSWAKLKKAELVLLAQRKLAGTGWLPPPLRKSGTVQPGDAQDGRPARSGRVSLPRLRPAVLPPARCGRYFPLLSAYAAKLQT